MMELIVCNKTPSRKERRRESGRCPRTVVGCVNTRVVPLHSGTFGYAHPVLFVLFRCGELNRRPQQTPAVSMVKPGRSRKEENG